MRCWLVLASLLAGAAGWAGVYEDGLAAKQAGRHDEAARLLQRAVATQPENAEAWFHYGTVLGWLNRHDEALAALRRGLALAPQDFDLRLGEARVLAWKADYAAAENRLTQLQREFPDNLDAMILRGRVAGWRGDPQNARQLYEAALQADPQQVDALTGLGDLAAAEGDAQAARPLYERAITLDASPDNLRRLEALDRATQARFDFGLTGSTFARQPAREDWWSAYASYSQKLGGWDAWLRYEHGERFGLQDEAFELGVSGTVAGFLRATLFGGFSPDASHSAEHYADAALHWRLYGDLGPLGAGRLLTETRRAEYALSGLWTTRLGWEQELAKGWTVNARWLHFLYDDGGAADGWMAWLQCEPRERWLIRFGAGQSVESLTSQTLRTGGQTLTSWTLFAGVVVPVSERWHVRFDLEREEVQGSVVRYGAGLGAGVRF